MVDDDFEIHYCVKCRMSLTDDFHVMGFARTEEHKNGLVEHMKKTWRYVDVSGYRAHKYVEPKLKTRRKKNAG